MLAGLPGLKGTLLLRLLGRDGLGGVVALLRTRHHGAGAGPADLNGDLGAGRLGRVLGHLLLGHAALLDRPIGAFLIKNLTYMIVGNEDSNKSNK